MLPSIAVYQRREPEHDVLWQCVKEHLPAFLAKAEMTERSVPKYVRLEFERFLTCGVLEEGCAVVRCEGCGFTRLVAFSCKGRGVCPSCIARRMSDTAAYLVEQVIPKVPIRQWVLSLPVPLRYLLGWDCELSSEVIRIFMEAVFRHLRRVAKEELGLGKQSDSYPGGICNVQRWGGSLNLNPHLHALVTCGVFVREADGTVRFRALREPTKAEIAAVSWDICERVVGLLRKRGQWVDDTSAEGDRFAQDEPVLSALYTASIQGTLVMGSRAGQRQVRLFGAAARSVKRPTPSAKRD
jgi:hypothetical protein